MTRHSTYLFLDPKIMFLGYYSYSRIKTNEIRTLQKSFSRYKQYVKKLKKQRDDEISVLYRSYLYREKIQNNIEHYNISKKLYQKEKFEYEQRNSNTKERMLFDTYEKSNISLFHTIRINMYSNILLRLTTKEIKQVYVNPQSYTRYCIDGKRLEKMFNVNQQRTTDQNINLILRNSTLEKLSRIYKHKTQINKNASKAPPNILREYFRTDSLLQTMKSISLTDLYYIPQETESFKRFYTELYWNSVFLTRISHDVHNLHKRVLKYTYSFLYRNHVLSAEYLYYTHRSVVHTKETTSKINFFVLCNEKKLKSLKKNFFLHYCIGSLDTNIQLQNSLYTSMRTLIVKKIIRIELRNNILTNYTPYIIMMSKQYLRVGYNAQLSLLIHEGSLGMIEAIDRFLIGRGVRFLTYAYWWMHRYIIKVATKKQHIIKLSKQNKKRKRLDHYISKLYYNLKQTNIGKKIITETKDTTKKIANTGQTYFEKTEATTRKQFILFCLYTGIPPYQKHTIDHLARIFDVSDEVIFDTIKKHNILV